MSEYGIYRAAAEDVADTIEGRDGTHGSPEAFGATFAALLNAYLRPIVAAGRPISPADGFVVLDLMKSARIAVGGPSPDHFRDKAGYGLLGFVHTETVIAAGRAAQAAKDGAQAALEEEAMRAEGDPDRRVTGDRGPKGPLGHYATDTRQEVPAHVQEATQAAVDEEEGEASAEARAAALDDLLHPDAEPVDQDEADDTARASGVDLLRWVLDPAGDAWADLLEPAGADPKVREPRPGVSKADVQARFDRLHAMLDQDMPPKGVTVAQWAAAKARVLPPLYGEA